MRRLDDDPDVKKLAYDLGLNWERDAVAEITRFCRRKVERWISGHGEVRSIASLEELICERLGLVVEEVWSDEGLEAVCRKYAALGDRPFLFLADKLDTNNLGTLVERKSVAATARDRYVALIDCRDENAHRRFFTRWHEIAHLLTGCFDRRPGLEKLMDRVAAEFAFFQPILLPALHREVQGKQFVEFDDFRRVREYCCPTASYQALLTTCVRLLSRPLVYLEVGLALKAHEARQVNLGQMQLFPEAAPTQVLRAVTVVGNQAAADCKLHIPRNMRVPEESIIWALHRDGGQSSEFVVTRGRESLAWWRSSDGSQLSDIVVHVQALCTRGQILALVEPA